jgi:hypothetical protein
MGFNRLLGFNVFYWDLMGFNGIHMGFNGIYIDFKVYPVTSINQL